MIKTIEKIFSVKPFKPLESKFSSKSIFPLPKNPTIAVIGGGISGPCFVRSFLRLAKKENISPKIFLFNKRTCNYCAGLMTEVSRETLKILYSLEVPKELILSNLESCVFINSYGDVEVPLDMPLVSMLRTEKFGIHGLDENLRERMLEGMEDMSSALTVIEPSLVYHVTLPDLSKNKKGRVSFEAKGTIEEIEADCIVIATGLQSLKTDLMKQITKELGYVPPRVMPTGITEVDLSKSRSQNIAKK